MEFQMWFLHIPKRNFLKECILASQCAYVLLNIDTVYSSDISWIRNVNRDGKEERTVGNVRNVSFISQKIVRNSRLEKEGFNKMSGLPSNI